MQKIFTIKNLLIVTIVVGVISLLTYLFELASPPLPKIIFSSPQTNSLQNNVTSPVTLKFDIPVVTNNFSITSTPSEDWQVNQLDNQTITLDHKQYLKSGTKYVFSLKYKDKQLTDYIFTTTTGQTDPRLQQELKSELDRDYPLALKTPYITPLYRVVYIAPMTLEITIKNPNITSQKAIEETKSWVSQNGGDVDSHIYTIASPKASPSSKSIR